MTDRLAVSHSRLSTKAACDRQFHYSYERRIEPIEDKDFLRLGTTGHIGIEKFYTLLKKNFEYRDAANAAVLAIMESGEDISIQLEAAALVRRYCEYYRNDARNYRVLEIEKRYLAPLTDTYDLDFTVDLLMEKITGTDRGTIEVWDNKFIQNFKSPDEINIDAQLPRYFKGLTLLGVPVRKARFNMIRTRDMKDPTDTDLFKRSTVPMSSFKVDTVWLETQELANRIEKDEATNVRPVRAQSTMVCRYCSFKEICISELSGEAPIQIQRLYRPKRERVISETSD